MRMQKNSHREAICVKLVPNIVRQNRFLYFFCRNFVLFSCAIESNFTVDFGDLLPFARTFISHSVSVCAVWIVASVSFLCDDDHAVDLFLIAALTVANNFVIFIFSFNHSSRTIGLGLFAISRLLHFVRSARFHRTHKINDVISHTRSRRRTHQMPQCAPINEY